MTSRVANHIHRYKKKDISSGKGYFVYKCMKPTCSHYVPIHLAENRLCECNRCHEPFLLSKELLYGSGGSNPLLPHCGDCTKKRKVTNVEATNAVLEFLEQRDEAKNDLDETS